MAKLDHKLRSWEALKSFMTPNECLSYWLIEELVAQGITQFCISPGSRSTPLTVAAARHPRANTQIFLDERAAAYFALAGLVLQIKQQP